MSKVYISLVHDMNLYDKAQIPEITKIELFYDPKTLSKFYRPKLNIDQFWVTKKDHLPIIKEFDNPYNLTINLGNLFYLLTNIYFRYTMEL